MAEVKFRKRRAYVWGAFGFVVLLTAPFVLVALWDIATWGTGRQILKYDAFGTVVFLLALESGLGALLVWLISNQLSLKFTTEGVGQRGLAGWKFIPWDEVTHVTAGAYWLELHSWGKKVIIPRLAYADCEEVVRFIAAQAPEGPPPLGGS